MFYSQCVQALCRASSRGWPMVEERNSAKFLLPFDGPPCFPILEHWNKNEDVNEFAIIAQPGYAMRLTCRAYTCRKRLFEEMALSAVSPPSTQR